MQVEMPIGKTCVALSYTQHKDSDVYDIGGQRVVDTGVVSELHSVSYKGKPISLKYQWEEAARRYIENL